MLDTEIFKNLANLNSASMYYFQDLKIQHMGR